MRLSDFILQNTEAIVAEWEAFAATLLPAAASLPSLALRDHAQQILEAIAQDLRTTQSPEEQSEKSKGRASRGSDAPETAAQTHAVLRARGGFDINQLVAEYRAMRASVLRLWMEASPLGPDAPEDMIRFNEAMDQAIAESVGHFHGHEERARNLLLGMLGHDMRNPLNTIVTTASYLAALNAGEAVSNAADRLIRSGASIQALLNDLVDFNRTKLGLGINIAPTEVDLAVATADEVKQFEGIPDCQPVELSVEGNCHGRWDGLRLQQVVRNLLSNAIRYRTADTPVRIHLRGEAENVSLTVTNSGPPIALDERGSLFDPLKRGIAHSAPVDSAAHLGLGLFIVREIARAHGGDVEVHCDQGETTFVVRLPREPSPAPNF